MNSLDMTHLVALAAALGWASGFRLYAAVFLVGLAGYSGWLPLPPGLQVLQHPAVLGVSGFMLLMEFFADKIPFIDSIWDVIHTVIRIPAGAALAAAALGADGATMTTVGALMGGTLAAASHATKMTTRAAVNTSPEPTHPVVFGIALCIALALMAVLLALLFKFLTLVVRKIAAFFSGAPAPQGT
jgi:hypothetical protein